MIPDATSHAWGFASRYGDYDERFLYVQPSSPGTFNRSPSPRATLGRGVE